ncbi:ribonuclease HII [Rhizosaccharibacter radicis]|uniref:Ribonuclease HII n=1 Tax=Rhizosaccharibacter radicis TaxID=2782605 RepID=A0ABT1VZH8_9PROT|nr:ribonuclease HII [Acetobacteraceae bacterium KSS12]
MPDYSHETTAGGLVAGVDEVGRGPLAGPVVAAAVIFLVPPEPDLAGCLDDSKRLSIAAREHAYGLLRRCPDVLIAVSAASVPEIARFNILQASMLAMSRAVARLPRRPDLVLVDGNRCPPLACASRALVGGDGLSLSIAAASIVAKVLRDRLMARLAARFPDYGWARNAGYGTAAHRAALLRHGATRHHRAGFGTVRQAMLELAPAGPAGRPVGIAPC